MSLPILVTTDASRLVAAFEAKLGPELERHERLVTDGPPHVVSDYAVYRYETGLIAAYRDARKMLHEAINDLASPERKEQP